MSFNNPFEKYEDNNDIGEEDDSISDRTLD